MNRSSLLLAAAILLFAGTCLAQSQPQPGSESRPAAVSQSGSESQPAAESQINEPSAVPLTPETVVPDAKDGKDPYGRPVAPVTPPEKADAPPPVPADRQQEDETCWSQDRRAHLAPWSPLAGPAKVETASGIE